MLEPAIKDASSLVEYDKAVKGHEDIVAVQHWTKHKEKPKDFKTAEELKLLPEASANYNKIVDAIKNIDTTIEKGDEQCKKVLDNHEKQFLLAYRTHMMNIYKEIGDLQAKSSDTAAQNLKITNKYRVEEALKFFKEETLRLSKIFKENEAEIDKLKKMAETHEFDKGFLELQLVKKRAKIETLKGNVNKTASLFQKLIHSEAPGGENVLAKHREIELRKDQIALPKEGLTKKKMEPSDYDRNIEDFLLKLIDIAETDEEIVQEVETYINRYTKDLEKELKELRSELEYEKNKYQQTRNVFLSQITNRSELETFFFECLGEMRKEILHKGPRGLIGESEGEEKPIKAGAPTLPHLDSSRYQALQAVLSNDRILITLFDEIFGPPAKREELPALFKQSLPKGVRGHAKKVGNITSPDYQDLHSYLDYFPEDAENK